jgi:hypothetical protein
MRVPGIWHPCDDGIVRPVLAIDVTDSVGQTLEELFLIDSGADQTVFSEGLLNKLGGSTASAPTGVALAGIGGSQSYVQVAVILNLRRSDGGIATIQANFAAFTDPKATDLSILGRDVLDHFDVILSRRRDEILLLAPPSWYDVHP